MLSRRSFIITGICTAASTSAVGSSIKRSSSWFDTTEQDEQDEKIQSLTFKSLNAHKGKSLRLLGSGAPIEVKIADVHDMNTDRRLEQFSLRLEANGHPLDLSGVYQAQLVEDSTFADFPISIVSNQTDNEGSQYFAVFSRIRLV